MWLFMMLACKASPSTPCDDSRRAADPGPDSERVEDSSPLEDSDTSSHTGQADSGSTTTAPTSTTTVTRCTCSVDDYECEIDVGEPGTANVQVATWAKLNTTFPGYEIKDGAWELWAAKAVADEHGAAVVNCATTSGDVDGYAFRITELVIYVTRTEVPDLP